MEIFPRIAIVILVSALASCSDNDDKTQDDQPLSGQSLELQVSPTSMQGLWLSDGYMTLLEITDNSVLRYELSSVHCLLVDDTDLPEYVEQTPHFLSNEERKRFATDADLSPDEVHAYYYDRIEKKPDACVSGITDETDSSVDNFTVLWNVFNEQYSFFDLRNINWQAQYDENIAAAESADSEEVLFGIFSDMIEVFGNDSHVYLEAGDEADTEAGVDSAFLTRMVDQFTDSFSEQQLLESFSNQSEYEDFDDYVEERFELFYAEQLQIASEIVAGYMIGDELKSAANEQITWGITEGNVGYLAVASMIEFIDLEEAINAINSGEITVSEAISQASNALNDALDLAMADLSGTDAIIIDIRTNGGGFDSLGLEIASRFYDQRRLAFRKKARKGNGFSEEVEIYLEPSVETPYTKPVFVLTSGETGSAAEIFTISMRSLPHVTLIGETTEGILSDVLEATLPNGWVIGLSNEVYTSADNEIFESVGIPAAVSALFIDPDFVTNQQDAALEAVLQGI